MAPPALDTTRQPRKTPSSQSSGPRGPRDTAWQRWHRTMQASLAGSNSLAQGPAAFDPPPGLAGPGAQVRAQHVPKALSQVIGPPPPTSNPPPEDLEQQLADFCEGSCGEAAPPARTGEPPRLFRKAYPRERRSAHGSLRPHLGRFPNSGEVPREVRRVWQAKELRPHRLVCGTVHPHRGSTDAASDLLALLLLMLDQASLDAGDLSFGWCLTLQPDPPSSLYQDVSGAVALPAPSRAAVHRPLPRSPAPCALHPCTVPVHRSPCTVIARCPGALHLPVHARAPLSRSAPSLPAPVHPYTVPVHRYRAPSRAPLSRSAPVPSLPLRVHPCTVPVHRDRSLPRSPAPSRARPCTVIAPVLTRTPSPCTVIALCPCTFPSSAYTRAPSSVQPCASLSRSQPCRIT